MNSARYLMMALFISVTSGCASFGQMEGGLNSLIGRNEQEAFSVLGYPSGKQQFGGDTVYIWEVSRTGTLLLPQTVTTYGSVGAIPIYGTTMYNQAVQVNNNCLIKIAANSGGTLINWEYSGNYGGCTSYIDRLDTYNKLRNPKAKNKSDISIDEKKGWVKAISEANGCDSPGEITQTKVEGVREFYNVACANKKMEVQCEFIGPVFSGIKGIPFVKVTGKSYDSQPACWQ
jgi:hypothetical protein